MRVPGRLKRWLAGFLLIVLAGLGTIVWLERGRVFSWYYVRGLARALDSDRDTWVESVTALDDAAVPELLRCLCREDPRACAHAQLCLVALVKRWGTEDARCSAALSRLAERFPRLSSAGQRNALELGNVVAQLGRGKTLAPFVPASLAAMLLQITHIPDRAVRARGLVLAETLIEKPASTEIVEASRELTRTCLRDPEPLIRARAARFALNPWIEQRVHLVPLLNDPVAEIRRATMLAVGPVPEIIATDDLLRWLHDPDPEVRRLCEGSLRGRGLQDDHLRMARLITDERPAIRLQVLDQLNGNCDLEPGVWLRRLSHDPAPAVRAASLRVVAEKTLVDLTDRLEQMAKDDPSPTIRQLARFYLSCRK